MKITKLTASLVLGSSMFLMGCTHSTYYATAPVMNYTQVQLTTDAKILGTLMVLDRSEIKAAELAQHRASHPDVLRFATWMKNEHMQNLQQTEVLSNKLNLQPIKGSTAIALQRKGEREVYQLRHTSRHHFDRVYMRDIVKGHRGALRLIAKLDAMATSPALKAHLRDTQAHVQAHLNDAVAIENSLHR